jgi:hypothetical protein
LLAGPIASFSPRKQFAERFPSRKTTRKSPPSLVGNCPEIESKN